MVEAHIRASDVYVDLDEADSLLPKRVSLDESCATIDHESALLST
jgi:hypothetical protein